MTFEFVFFQTVTDVEYKKEIITRWNFFLKSIFNKYQRQISDNKKRKRQMQHSTTISDATFLLYCICADKVFRILKSESERYDDVCRETGATQDLNNVATPPPELCPRLTNILTFSKYIYCDCVIC